MSTIDRQAAIDALCKAGCGSDYCGISCDDVKAIEQLPAVETEIIRCKYCKWFDDNMFGCKYPRNGASTKAYDFCSHAERREKNEPD